MSRRALLATGGLTLAGACIGVATLPDDRDAKLLALLAEFERLEAEIYALAPPARRWKTKRPPTPPATG